MPKFKKTIFLLLLLVSAVLTAQNSSESILDRYNEFVNYIPKSLETDTIHIPEIPISKTAFNTIINAKLYYGLKHYKKFTEKEIAWMDEKINTLAIALHSEGTYTLLGQIGGAGGCREKNLLKTRYLNDIKITQLNFCHG